MTAGQFLPEHRRGHCGHDPQLDGSICHAPAGVHLLVEDPDDPPAFSVFACEAHAAQAFAMPHATDAHLVDAPCLVPGVSWQHGDPSFCSDDAGDGAALDALAAALPTGVA